MASSNGLKAVRLEELDISKSCKSCRHLAVCWLVPSVKNALKGHSEQTSIMMFPWETLAIICTKYDYMGMQIEIENEELR